MGNKMQNATGLGALGYPVLPINQKVQPEAKFRFSKDRSLQMRNSFKMLNLDLLRAELVVNLATGAI
jgi:hypothetical protein